MVYDISRENDRKQLQKLQSLRWRSGNKTNLREGQNRLLEGLRMDFEAPWDGFWGPRRSNWMLLYYFV